MSGLRIGEPSELIAALPAILRFTPTDSLILVDEAVGWVMMDLRVADVDQLATVAHRRGAQLMAAVVIDADDGEHELLCVALRMALAGHGIQLIAAYVADKIAAGGRWRCGCGCGATGQVNDPRASPVAASAVLAGNRLYGTRAELEAMVAPDEQPVAIPDIDPAEAIRAALRAVMNDQVPLTAEVLGAMVVALGDPDACDLLVELSVADADLAAALFGELSRRLPMPWRADALALLAFTAYADGDGALAGVAIDEALRVAPCHRGAQMLDMALRLIIGPSQLRDLIGDLDDREPPGQTRASGAR